MKKCPRCKIVFHLDERIRCLYCDTLLFGADTPEDLGTVDFTAYAPNFKIRQSFIQAILKNRNVEEIDRIHFVLNNYFHVRTFHFIYAFCRREYLMGKEFRRVFVQPLSVYSILMLPWVVLNVVDTLFCRLYYNGFCVHCQSKYHKSFGSQNHDDRLCQYNREYIAVVDDIMTGRIAETENDFKRLEAMKKAAGRRSAYGDLSGRTAFFSNALDVVCIWFSMFLWIVLAIRLFFPSVFAFFKQLE